MIAALALLLASIGHCDETVFSGSKLDVVHLPSIDTSPDFQIRSIRLLNESVFDVVVVNRENSPITVSGIVVFLHYTGRPILVVGGTAGPDELATQVKPGESTSRVACLAGDGTTDHYGMLTYACLYHSELEVSDTDKVLVILSHVYVDNADRD